MNGGLLLILLASGGLAAADPAVSPNWPPLEHVSPPDGRPTEPIRLFNPRLPFKLGPIEGTNELSIDFHEGNTWNPTVVLEYPGFQPPSAAPDVQVPISKAPSGTKIYGAQGVVEANIIRYTRKLTPTDEISFALSVFRLNTGSAPWDYFASAHLIEWTHRTIFHQNDPSQRSINGLDNRAQIVFHGLKGDTYQINAGQVFLGTLDVGNTKYIVLARNRWTLATLGIGAFAGIPMNAFNPDLSLGVSISLADTVRIYGGSSVTVGVQVSGQDNKLLALGPGSSYVDQDLEGDYRAVAAYSYDFWKSGARIAAGLEIQGATAPLEQMPLNPAPVSPATIGVQTPYMPRTGLETSYRGQLRGSEYATIFAQFRPGPAGKAPTVHLYVQEDWDLFFGAPPFLLFRQSNNLQDWGVGMRVVQPF